MMLFKTNLQLHTHKEGADSTESDRDFRSKRLGAKQADGQLVLAGNILYRQRGTHVHPGVSVGRDGDDTLLATTDGVVKFKRWGRYRKKVSIYPKAEAAK